MFDLYAIKLRPTLLTCPDELRKADFAVTFGADGVHSVRVQLTTACIREVTCVVCRPALGHLAGVVLSFGHIIEGVVGRLPAEDDHVAGAVTEGGRISRSTGHWRDESYTLQHFISSG